MLTLQAATKRRTLTRQYRMHVKHLSATDGVLQVRNAPHRDLVVPPNIQLVDQCDGAVADHAAEQLELAPGAQVHGHDHVVALRRRAAQPGAEVLQLAAPVKPSCFGIAEPGLALCPASWVV